MAYSDVHEAIVGVLRASGVAGFDWAAHRNPYYVEAAEPLPGFPGSLFAETPFPFVVYELPESVIEHTMGDPYIETYRPTFYVIGTEKHRKTILSPYAAESVIRFLDSLRGTTEKPRGYDLFSSNEFQCIQFTRSGYYLGKDASRGTSGERVWVSAVKYDMKFNLG